MKVRSCGCLVLCNVLLGGFCTRYVIEVWGTHSTHAAVHAPLIPCIVAGLFVGEFTVPIAAVTWLLRASGIL